MEIFDVSLMIKVSLMTGKIKNTLALQRGASRAIHPLFLERWSPRSFSERAVPQADIDRMLEAARFAPSWYNVQPWRFAVSHRGDDNWDEVVSLFDELNAVWAPSASALVFLASDTVVSWRDDREDQAASYNSFDAGAAWAQFALQATEMGYFTHAVAGLKHDEARAVLSIPARYKLEIAIVLGHRSAPERLPDYLQEREKPSSRLALEEIAGRGRFI